MTPNTTHSAIYVGDVRHRRFKPRPHAFRYRMFMMYLDLAELPTLFDRRWLWSADRFNLACYQRKDHIGDPALPLDAWVRDHVAEQTGQRPAGPIRLLTHLRYFGYCMNPASFYYCFSADGSRVETICVEIHNTPWKERHLYVLPIAENLSGSDNTERYHFQFAKTFHVSPFMPMTQQYDWRFLPPGERLFVHMNNFEAGEKIFDATLNLQRRPITGGNLAGVLTRYPFMTSKVIAGIYWQAMRLWLKKTPFFSHPKYASAT